ncbi:MAG: hypothetical protein A2Y60_04025 [Chloroflexi bacterium RBG_13_54_9]|nr:MAG: hypothetical protein A2Y60_04025 [Chloroflexi bacterium RBG_13_54_9]
MNWYIKVLNSYAVFSGRARRKEYWMFFLFNFIFGLVASFIDLGIGLLTFAAFGFGLLYILYTLAVLVPGLAVAVRRLHDVGKSGWYYLVVLIPIAGAIWFLVLTCTDSQTGDNKYGPNPKEEKESDNSVADRNEAIELAPDSADAYHNRGDAYDQMGEYGKAIADYNKAIELDPNYASAYYNRGCAYGEIGAYDKAVADYNKAIELNPNDSLAYYNRGLAHSKRGEVSKAVSDLVKCIELSTDPELSKDAQQALDEAKRSP